MLLLLGPKKQKNGLGVLALLLFFTKFGRNETTLVSKCQETSDLIDFWKFSEVKNL